MAGAIGEKRRTVWNEGEEERERAEREREESGSTDLE